MGRPLPANHKTIGTEGRKDPLRLSGGFSYTGFAGADRDQCIMKERPLQKVEAG
jgi:hypothetical protein